MCQLNDFIKHVPSWGGRFTDLNGPITRIRLTNTCTIDYFLLGFWYVSKVKAFFKTKITLCNLEAKKEILNVIDLIEKMNGIAQNRLG